MSKNDKHEQHHILTNAMALKVWGALICLTFITVAVAQIDLGALNFAVAMLVASVKATLVCMFFMGLKYDHKENVVIFSTSIIFLSIFMILTFGDLITRGDVYVKDSKIIPDSFTAGAVTKSGNAQPWVATPELIAHGKEDYLAQCTACHGAAGKGDGPAAAGFNPKPRNFTAAEGWKQGRKASEIFITLSKGLGAMPSFASASIEDRWAMAHYIRTLGPHEKEIDTPEDLKKTEAIK